MINIPVEQAQKRFQSLPEELKNAIFSLHNAEIIDKISEENNLNETKQRAVAKLVGYVFLGFLDYKDDLAREISTAIGAKPEDAKKISGALDSRIFSSLKGELSLAYQPLSATEGRGLPFQIGAIPPAPIAISGQRYETGDMKPRAATLRGEQETSPASPTIPASPMPPVRPTLPATPTIPAGAVAPTTISVSAPLPPAPPQSATSNIRQETSPAMSPTTFTTPTTAKTSSTPAPFILHQEAESQPLAQQKSKLSFQFTPSKDALQKDAGKPIEILKPRAQVEIGGEVESSKLKVESKSFFSPSGPAGTQQAQDAQRVVHYSPFRTPVYAPLMNSDVLNETRDKASKQTMTGESIPTGRQVNAESDKLKASGTPVPPIALKNISPSPTLPSSPTIQTRPVAPSSPNFTTDRFASSVPATAATPVAPKTIPAAPMSPTFTTPITTKTVTSSPTPPKMADIIAANKPFDSDRGRPFNPASSIELGADHGKSASPNHVAQTPPPAPKRVDYQ